MQRTQPGSSSRARSGGGGGCNPGASLRSAPGPRPGRRTARPLGARRGCASRSSRRRGSARASPARYRRCRRRRCGGGDPGSRGWARRRRGGTVAQPTNQIAPSRSSTGNVFSGRAPVVAFTAPASGLNAPWGPRTIAPVPTSYSAACHGHCRHPSSVTRPFPSEANRWRQRLETANGLPALMPTARAPCGVCSTTTTREAPRSSTATSRAVDCSDAVTRPLSHTSARRQVSTGTALDSSLPDDCTS
jgi:hypothetical protein